MHKNKKYLLQASSLIEVLVSLVIISILVSFGMGSYIKVANAKPLLTLKIRKQLKEIAEKSIQASDYESRTYVLNNGTFANQSVEPYGQDTSLYVYELKAESNRHREIIVLRKIILKYNEKVPF